MVYQIEIDSVAKRFLKKLTKTEYQAIRNDIEGLAENPRPDGYIKMTNTKRELYRICSGTKGDFRVFKRGIPRKHIATWREPVDQSIHKKKAVIAATEIP